jgi:hypothetical protein
MKPDDLLDGLSGEETPDGERHSIMGRILEIRFRACLTEWYC